jgi:hypothetical protein
MDLWVLNPIVCRHRHTIAVVGLQIIDGNGMREGRGGGRRLKMQIFQWERKILTDDSDRDLSRFPPDWRPPSAMFPSTRSTIAFMPTAVAIVSSNLPIFQYD